MPLHLSISALHKMSLTNMSSIKRKMSITREHEDYIYGKHWSTPHQNSEKDKQTKVLASILLYLLT